MTGFEEIADTLRRDIQSGKYAPGDRVPGEVQLMGMFQVSQPTAWRALHVLKAEGLIWAKRGAGTFVTAPPPAPPTAG